MDPVPPVGQHQPPRLRVASPVILVRVLGNLTRAIQSYLRLPDRDWIRLQCEGREQDQQPHFCSGGHAGHGRDGQTFVQTTTMLVLTPFPPLYRSSDGEEITPCLITNYSVI